MRQIYETIGRRRLADSMRESLEVVTGDVTKGVGGDLDVSGDDENDDDEVYFDASDHLSPRHVPRPASLLRPLQPLHLSEDGADHASTATSSPNIAALPPSTPSALRRHPPHERRDSIMSNRVRFSLPGRATPVTPTTPLSPVRALTTRSTSVVGRVLRTSLSMFDGVLTSIHWVWTLVVRRRWSACVVIAVVVVLLQRQRREARRQQRWMVPAAAQALLGAFR